MKIFFVLILFMMVCLGTDWSPIDILLEESIIDHAFPGCVALIASKDKVLYRKAFGYYTYDKEIKMQTDTLFDLASVTKVLATTTATALLYQQGLLKLEDKVTKYFPEFGQEGKEEITIENLLLHNSGFPPDPWPNYWNAEFNCPETPKSKPELSYSCFEKIYNDRNSKNLTHIIPTNPTHTP